MKKTVLILLLSSLALLFVTTDQARAQAGQIFQTIVGEPQESFTEDKPDESGGGANPDPGPAPNCSNINNRLKNDFNVVVKAGSRGWLSTPRGYSSETPNCQTKQTIYQTLTRAFRSPAFRRKYKIDSNDWVIECYKNSESFMRGTVNTAYLDGVQLSNCNKYITSSSYGRALLVHEMGHHFSGRTGGMSSRVPWVSLRSKDGGACYNSAGIIKSYGTVAYSAAGESFAEAIMLYVYNRSFTNVGIPISSFKSQCTATRNWFKINVHNGFNY